MWGSIISSLGNFSAIFLGLFKWIGQYFKARRAAKIEEWFDMNHKVHKILMKAKTPKEKMDAIKNIKRSLDNLF